MSDETKKDETTEKKEERWPIPPPEHVKLWMEGYFIHLIQGGGGVHIIRNANSTAEGYALVVAFKGCDVSTIHLAPVRDALPEDIDALGDRLKGSDIFMRIPAETAEQMVLILTKCCPHHPWEARCPQTNICVEGDTPEAAIQGLGSKRALRLASLLTASNMMLLGPAAQPQQVFQLLRLVVHGGITPVNMAEAEQEAEAETEQTETEQTETEQTEA